jgi:hypothetical protein
LPRRPTWSTNLLKQHKTLKKKLLASNYGTFRAIVVCENFIVPQNEPSTQLIDPTSFV